VVVGIVEVFRQREAVGCCWSKGKSKFEIIQSYDLVARRGIYTHTPTHIFASTIERRISMPMPESVKERETESHAFVSARAERKSRVRQRKTKAADADDHRKPVTHRPLHLCLISWQTLLTAEQPQ
jgi:hypothetical protein